LRPFFVEKTTLLTLDWGPYN